MPLPNLSTDTPNGMLQVLNFLSVLLLYLDRTDPQRTFCLNVLNQVPELANIFVLIRNVAKSKLPFLLKHFKKNWVSNSLISRYLEIPPNPASPGLFKTSDAIQAVGKITDSVTIKPGYKYDCSKFPDFFRSLFAYARTKKLNHSQILSLLPNLMSDTYVQLLQFVETSPLPVIVDYFMENCYVSSGIAIQTYLLKTVSRQEQEPLVDFSSRFLMMRLMIDNLLGVHHFADLRIFRKDLKPYIKVLPDKSSLYDLAYDSWNFEVFLEKMNRLEMQFRRSDSNPDLSDQQIKLLRDALEDTHMCSSTSLNEEELPSPSKKQKIGYPLTRQNAMSPTTAHKYTKQLQDLASNHYLDMTRPTTPVEYGSNYDSPVDKSTLAFSNPAYEGKRHPLPPTPRELHNSPEQSSDDSEYEIVRYVPPSSVLPVSYRCDSPEPRGKFWHLRKILKDRKIGKSKHSKDLSPSHAYKVIPESRSLSPTKLFVRKITSSCSGKSSPAHTGKSGKGKEQKTHSELQPMELSSSVDETQYSPSSFQRVTYLEKQFRQQEKDSLEDPSSHTRRHHLHDITFHGNSSGSFIPIPRDPLQMITVDDKQMPAHSFLALKKFEQLIPHKPSLLHSPTVPSNCTLDAWIEKCHKSTVSSLKDLASVNDVSRCQSPEIHNLTTSNLPQIHDIHYTFHGKPVSSYPISILYDRSPYLSIILNFTDHSKTSMLALWDSGCGVCILGYPAFQQFPQHVQDSIRRQHIPLGTASVESNAYIIGNIDIILALRSSFDDRNPLIFAHTFHIAVGLTKDCYLGTDLISNEHIKLTEDWTGARLKYPLGYTFEKDLTDPDTKFVPFLYCTHDEITTWMRGNPLLARPVLVPNQSNIANTEPIEVYSLSLYPTMEAYYSSQRQT